MLCLDCANSGPCRSYCTNFSTVHHIGSAWWDVQQCKLGFKTKFSTTFFRYVRIYGIHNGMFISHAHARACVCVCVHTHVHTLMHRYEKEYGHAHAYMATAV